MMSASRTSQAAFETIIEAHILHDVALGTCANSFDARGNLHARPGEQL